jgi:hypothetical protein
MSEHCSNQKMTKNYSKNDSVQCSKNGWQDHKMTEQNSWVPLYIDIYTGRFYSSPRVMDQGLITWTQRSNQRLSQEPARAPAHVPYCMALCRMPHAHPPHTAWSCMPATEPRAASHMRASPDRATSRPRCSPMNDWGCSSRKWLSTVATMNDWALY